MKAICLVVVVGGVAYTYAPSHVDCRVVDIDERKCGGDKVELPPGVGFEELVAEAEIENEVRWVVPT